MCLIRHVLIKYECILTLRQFIVFFLQKLVIFAQILNVTTWYFHSHVCVNIISIKKITSAKIYCCVKFNNNNVLSTLHIRKHELNFCSIKSVSNKNTFLIKNMHQQQIHFSKIQIQSFDNRRCLIVMKKSLINIHFVSS